MLGCLAQTSVTRLHRHKRKTRRQRGKPTKSERLKKKKATSKKSPARAEGGRKSRKKREVSQKSVSTSLFVSVLFFQLFALFHWYSMYLRCLSDWARLHRADCRATSEGMRSPNPLTQQRSSQCFHPAHTQVINQYKKKNWQQREEKKARKGKENQRKWKNNIKSKRKDTYVKNKTSKRNETCNKNRGRRFKEKLNRGNAWSCFAFSLDNIIINLSLLIAVSNENAYVGDLIEHGCSEAVVLDHSDDHVAPPTRGRLLQHGIVMLRNKARKCNAIQTTKPYLWYIMKEIQKIFRTKRTRERCAGTEKKTRSRNISCNISMKEN